MSFQESDLEELIINKIKQKGYEYISGENLNRDLENVLIEEDLINFLKSKYQTENITENEILDIINRLKRVSTANLYDGNKKVFIDIVSGTNFVRHDRNRKDFYLQLFDFEHPENNIFKVCNQVIIKGNQKRIPDAIIYINGIPVVVWEFKSTTREDATIHDAFTQITTRYTRDIPELFKYNAFVVISDGINSKMGSVFSDYEHFYAWRKVNEIGRASCRERV